MRIFRLKKIAISGEWWIIDGAPFFADAEIGDYNHSGVVIEHILNFHDLDTETTDIDNFDDNELLEKGLTQEEINVVRDRIDPREYGLKHLGWKRINGNNIQTQTLTQDDLRDIVNGLFDIDEDIQNSNETFNIEVVGNGRFYTDVPFSVLDSENISELSFYR